MDGPVVASLISSSVAILVAVGSAIRADLQRASDRRYERRRMFLIDAQDAALGLRDALRDYGQALAMTGRAREPAHSGRVEALKLAVAASGGRLAVAASRIEDDATSARLGEWERIARDSLIEASDATPHEEAAFAELNRVLTEALRSSSGLGRR